MLFPEEDLFKVCTNGFFNKNSGFLVPKLKDINSRNLGLNNFWYLTHEDDDQKDLEDFKFPLKTVYSSDEKLREKYSQSIL